MSTYPAGVDTFTTHTDGPNSVIYAAHVNALQDAVVAIEETLGANPQGGAGTVADRLAGAQLLTATAETALSSPRAVTFSEAGSVRYLDAADVADVGRLPLVTMQSAAGAGATVNLVGQGPTSWPAGGLTPGDPLFLGRFGTLMRLQPISVAFTQIIAYALDTNSIYVDPQPPILF